MRILIATDNTIFREGLQCLLEAMPKIQVVGETGNGRDAVRLAAETSPDIVLLDVSLPELNGIDATRRITRDRPESRVLALAAEAKVEQVSRILEAGALGFLLYDCDHDELQRALRVVSEGETYLAPAAAAVVVEQHVRKPGSKVRDPVFARLTDRQREVLQLIAEGLSSKEIARKLHVSRKTVDSHRQHVMEKLDCDSVPDLVKHAIRAGLTTTRT